MSRTLGSKAEPWWGRLSAFLGFRPRAQIPYEGASTGRRARAWRSPTVGPNAGVLGSLSLLRDRSRQAVRNDGYARRAIDALVSNIIGTGIIPRSQAVDLEFRARVQALWLRWTDESDADGRLDWYGQQALAVRSWLEAGELFVRLRQRFPTDGLSVPLQIQLIEPEIVPLTHNLTRGSNRIRAGIEFSPIGARVAYWMYRARPGDLQDMDVSQLVAVPAESVIHLYDPVRPGQIRGLPHLTQALIGLFELDQYDDATLVKQKVGALFAGFITPQPGAIEQELNPLTGRAIETDNGRGLMSLEPGLLQELQPGEEVNWSNPPAVGDSYADFTRQQLLRLAAAADLPVELLSGDFSKVNDRVVRVAMTEFRRRIMQRQHHVVVHQLCRPIWNAWFERAVVSGALEVPGGAAAYRENPEPFRRCRFVPQGFQYIHPVQDVDAALKAVRAGIRSLPDVIAELGEDAEDVLAEIAATNALADRLGLVLDSDPRKTDSGGKATAVTVAME